jgi:hypothetical protein
MEGPLEPVVTNDNSPFAASMRCEECKGANFSLIERKHHVDVICSTCETPYAEIVK